MCRTPDQRRPRRAPLRLRLQPDARAAAPSCGGRPLSIFDFDFDDRAPAPHPLRRALPGLHRGRGQLLRRRHGLRCGLKWGQTPFFSFSSARGRSASAASCLVRAAATPRFCGFSGVHPRRSSAAAPIHTIGAVRPRHSQRVRLIAARLCLVRRMRGAALRHRSAIPVRISCGSLTTGSPTLPRTNRRLGRTGLSSM